MNIAIRSITGAEVLLSPSKIQHKNCSVVRFRKLATTTVSSKPDSNKDNMDKPDQNPDEKFNEDVMSHSFGEGYATRSDEEGFGGIYGGNQKLPKVDVDKIIHESHPGYDRSQGSEVKEKEKGRHQSDG
ncbi:uncharacterized protein [Euphorbia lathyris]|uniref:uncharacterized protein n=1 Tax=Euphorbia lathyris TaxID=212925 RepID=UPI0033133B4B